MSHLILLMLVPFGVAYLMLLSGVQKSMLEWKRADRVCPACGRRARDCCCRF